MAWMCWRGPCVLLDIFCVVRLDEMCWILKKYPTFVMSYEYTQGRYVGEAHQSGPRVAREAGVSPAQYPLL